jgi:predicted DCC family thiol-disulfide oxidoreductase YuxK
MTAVEGSAIEGRPLLLYDGVCALCNGVVKFLMKRDRGDRFRYAPLQSGLGREVLARFGILEFPNGVVLVVNALTANERLYQRSDAVAASLRQLDRFWRGLGRALGLIPRWLREWGYGVVARYRYRVFGRYETCPVPSPNERGLLLGVYE